MEKAKETMVGKMLPLLDERQPEIVKKLLGLVGSSSAGSQASPLC